MLDPLVVHKKDSVVQAGSQKEETGGGGGGVSLATFVVNGSTNCAKTKTSDEHKKLGECAKAREHQQHRGQSEVKGWIRGAGRGRR